jgi:hypothetical protein
MGYIDPDKNKECTAYLFAATFPYSQYTYVGAAAPMGQSDWLCCNVHMLGFFEGSPVKVVCDNLKTGVITHPKHGEIALNGAYLSFAGHYQVAAMPAEVREPKQKPSAEGSVGKIARKIIGMLRHETSHSLEALSRGIMDALAKLNSKGPQKRNGSRKVLFETEEKPMVGALPLAPFGICGWSYDHKVGPNSHMWFEEGQYPVPSDYLDQYVDARYGNAIVYIYSSHKLIAGHKRLPSGLKNGKGAEASHLPYPVYIPETAEPTTAKAEEIGTNATTVACRVYENAKIKEQALMDVRSVPGIASIHGERTLGEACGRALKDFHMITYNAPIPYIKDISKSKKNKMKPENEKGQKHGTARSADYYRKEGAKQ